MTYRIYSSSHRTDDHMHTGNAIAVAETPEQAIKNHCGSSIGSEYVVIEVGFDGAVLPYGRAYIVTFSVEATVR